MTFSGKREKFMKTAPAVPEKCSFKKIGLMLQCPVLQKDNPGRTESPAGILRRNVDRRRRDFPIPLLVSE